MSALAEDRFIKDTLWERLESLIPSRPPAVNGRTGQPRVPDRKVFAGIVFVLLTGIPWRKLPSELGYGSGITCWRRLREWSEAGVWDALRRILLDELGHAKRSAGKPQPNASLNYSPANRRVATTTGIRPGPNPTDRGKLGTKYHVLTDRNGIPLHVEISGANRHDSMLVQPVLDNITAIKGVGRGRPRRRPVIFHADKAYDNRRVRRYLRRRGIKTRIARIGVNSKQRLGKHRWVVEHTMAWVLDFRKLATSYDRTAPTITTLVALAVAITSARKLTKTNY
ncbi:transposase [Leifsonia xyli subsp. xyli]|uniref:Transposase n=1 Tax=Leifsonia xyli subsp. xyli TaxID=59736 RepID=A0A1E2SIE0_LEIXY|nr:transposase [Leifsonia xyli subsp. xyli]